VRHLICIVLDHFYKLSKLRISVAVTMCFKLMPCCRQHYACHILPKLQAKNASLALHIMRLCAGLSLVVPHRWMAISTSLAHTARCAEQVRHLFACSPGEIHQRVQSVCFTCHATGM
jgi:hypothetical protein